MNMKKFAAGIVAAAMAMTLSVPVFADATPGEEAQDYAWKVIGATQQENAAEATTNMKEMVTLLQEDTEISVSAAMNSAGLTYFQMMEENGTIGEVNSDTDDQGVEYAIVFEQGAGFDFGSGSITVSEDASTITVSADNAVANPSPTGYAITVYLPDTASFSDHYRVTMLGENAQQNDTVVEVKGYLRDDGTTQKYVSFWVPHFTTYQLSTTTVTTEPVQNPTQQSSPDSHPEIAEAIANGTWGQKTTTSSGSQSTVTAENPIKKTGAAMDLGVVALVAVAAVAVCGVGVVAKKSHK